MEDFLKNKEDNGQTKSMYITIKYKNHKKIYGVINRVTSIFGFKTKKKAKEFLMSLQVHK